MKNDFYYNVSLTPIVIENSNQESFRKRMKELPYLLYEVEQLSGGKKIAINKPGGKKNFGRFAREDFMVFVVEGENPSKLSLKSHKEIYADICNKMIMNPEETKKLIFSLKDVCNGMEPEEAIRRNLVICDFDSEGLDCEMILKLYKWIWGQEDCNYPTGEGRWKSMNPILELVD